MKSPIQFNNLRNLIPTQKSRIKLAEETGILFSQINSWIDLDNESIPAMDDLIILAKYFGCSIDFLLDLADKQG
jgi:Helix-turn-helix.